MKKNKNTNPNRALTPLGLSGIGQATKLAQPKPKKLLVEDEKKATIKKLWYNHCSICELCPDVIMGKQIRENLFGVCLSCAQQIVALLSTTN